MNTSAQVIDTLGGPKKVAELLGITVPGAIQRVSNWKRRGIPPAVLLRHHNVFRPLIWPDLPTPSPCPRENPDTYRPSVGEYQEHAHE